MNVTYSTPQDTYPGVKTVVQDLGPDGAAHILAARYLIIPKQNMVSTGDYLSLDLHTSMSFSTVV